MVTRIRDEGFRHSKVMETASGLMDGIGARLTGSPNMERAQRWTAEQAGGAGARQRAPGELGPVRPRLELRDGVGAHDCSRRRAASRDSRGLDAGDQRAPSPGTRCTSSSRPRRTSSVQGKARRQDRIFGEVREVKPHEKAEFVALRREGVSTSSPIYEIPGNSAVPHREEFLKRRQLRGPRSPSSSRRKRRSRSSYPARSRRRGPRRAVGRRVAEKRAGPTRSRRSVMAIEHYGGSSRLLDRKEEVAVELDSPRTRFDRRGPDPVQHHRRDPRDGQAGRGRHARRPLRLLARGDRRDRQRRGRRRDDGGDADPQGDRGPPEAHDPHRALERGGAGSSRLAGLRDEPLRDAARRRSRDRRRTTSAPTTAP